MPSFCCMPGIEPQSTYAACTNGARTWEQSVLRTLPLKTRSLPVLVEETAWDARAHPTAGIVRAASTSRGDLQEPLRRCHHGRSVKTFLFYTGDPIPTDLTVVL